MALNQTFSKTLGTTEQVQVNAYGDGMLEFLRLLVGNGTTANGSPTVALADTNGVFAGAPISGAGIPAGALVGSFVASTSVTMKNAAGAAVNATASATVPVTINKTSPDRPYRREYPTGTLGHFIKDLFNQLDQVA